MELNIIQIFLIIISSRCFLPISSMRYRLNCRGYYTPFYKDKLCKNKEAEFGKKKTKIVSRVGSSNTENYNNSEYFF